YPLAPPCPTDEYRTATTNSAGYSQASGITNSAPAAGRLRHVRATTLEHPVGALSAPNQRSKCPGRTAPTRDLAASPATRPPKGAANRAGTRCVDRCEGPPATTRPPPAQDRPTS